MAKCKVKLTDKFNSTQRVAEEDDNTDDVVQMEPNNDDIGLSSDEVEEVDRTDSENSSNRNKEISSNRNKGEGVSKVTENDDRFREYEELLMSREDLFDRVMEKKRPQIDELLRKHRRLNEALTDE